jgi:hypothetical protein
LASARQEESGAGSLGYHEMHFINLSPGKVISPPQPFPGKDTNFNSVIKVARMNIEILKI